MESDGEEHYDSKVMLEGGLNLRDLSVEKPLEIAMKTVEGDNNYEDFMTQEPEMYYNHDDLMPHVDVSLEYTSFNELKLDMTDITNGAGMVFKKVVKAGVGEVCPPDAIVKFHYTSFREYLEVPFDVSKLRRKFPECKRLGQGELPIGLDLGLSTMQKNEVAHFIVHYEYAYGSLGCGERIPEKSSVLFKVELLDIERFEFPENEDPENLCQNKYDFKKLYEKAEKHVKEGTRFKKMDKNNNRAIYEYRKAAQILSNTPLNNDEEEFKKRKLITKAYTNLAVCFRAENKFKAVCNVRKDAVQEGAEIAENNAKLTYQFAEAQCGLHNFRYAERLYRKVIELDPTQEDYVNKALQRMAEKRKKSLEAERVLCAKMFQSR